MRRIGMAAACAAVLLVTIGCNSPAGMAVQLVGKAVDSVDVKQLGDELVGKPAAAADTRLGQPIDVWAEVDGAKSWRVYPVEMDVVGNQRYVVEVAGGMVGGVYKAKADATGIDLAHKMLLNEKVDGKSPAECEAALGMGRPLLTARSETTRMMGQLYDARTIKGVGSPKYCRLKFDAAQHCVEVQIIDVNAATGEAPPA